MGNVEQALQQSAKYLEQRILEYAEWGDYSYEEEYFDEDLDRMLGDQWWCNPGPDRAPYPVDREEVLESMMERAGTLLVDKKGISRGYTDDIYGLLEHLDALAATVDYCESP